MPGRLDPTVRSLLRTFLSPAIADRYTSALQPVAVADRDAAIAGAVSALRVRFGVPPVEIAGALVIDTGWVAEDAATLVGLPVEAVRDHLVHPDRVRLGPVADPADAGGTAVRPGDDAGPVDEAALVDAMLDRLPSSRRRAETPAGPAEVDVVHMSTSLPAHVGVVPLEERIARADRVQRRVVNGTIATVVVLVSLAVLQTRVPVPGGELDEDGDIDVVLPTPSPTATPAIDDEPDVAPSEGAEQPDVPSGAVELGEVLFVSSVDPATGDPGPVLETAPLDAEVRAWAELTRRPDRDVLAVLTFTAPDTTRTVRPVLLPPGINRLSVRLPTEIGREPGRYIVVVEVDEVASAEAEVELEVEPAA